MFKMSKINDHMMYICEGIILLIVMYYVYSYMYSLNTKINTLNNKLNIIETFLHESNISVPYLDKKSTSEHNCSTNCKPPPKQETKPLPKQETKPLPKQVKFDSKLNQTQEFEKHIDNINMLRQRVMMNINQPNIPNMNLFKQPNKIVEINDPSPNKKRKLDEKVVEEKVVEEKVVEEVVDEEEVIKMDVDEEEVGEEEVGEEEVGEEEVGEEMDVDEEEVDTSEIVEIDEEPEDVD